MAVTVASGAAACEARPCRTIGADEPAALPLPAPRDQGLQPHLRDGAGPRPAGRLDLGHALRLAAPRARAVVGGGDPAVPDRLRGGAPRGALGAGPGRAATLGDRHRGRRHPDRRADLRPRRPRASAARPSNPGWPACTVWDSRTLADR